MQEQTALRRQVHFKFLWHAQNVCSSSVSVLVLLPGMNQHGTITKYTEMAKKEVEKLLKKKEQDKKEQ